MLITYYILTIIFPYNKRKKQDINNLNNYNNNMLKRKKVYYEIYN